MRITLPDKRDIPLTGEEDPLVYYYLPIIGHFYRMRLWIPLNLMYALRFRNLLDVGYGCGIFYPELAKYADRLYGVDIHKDTDRVRNSLKKYNIQADLKTGDILDLPYDDEQFDGIICISVLEHIRDLRKAISELRRILTKDGTMILGFPVQE